MSENKQRRITVTAALPYANGPLHIGHLAGAYLPADIYVRYQRARGRDVHFVCGTDEYGAAIMLRARKEGVSEQEVIDKYYKLIDESFKGLNIQFDIFSRTTKPVHTETAQEFFRHFYENGLFREQETEQLFDPEAGQFLPDRYVTGECPKCHNPNAYGDQCEKCGSTLSPAELINPKSTLSGAAPELRTTTHWFLPLDQFQERIESFVAEHPEWKSNVLGQVKSWLNDGLQPRSITRDLSWGIPVPPEIPGSGGKALYVWFDAPIGYISASKHFFQQQNNPDGWKKYWLKQEKNDDDARLIHFIGKDNIVFHTIIFPAILMGKGDYILPDNVPANEFLNLEGDKLSTSRNWAIWAHEYLADPDLGHRVDELRYVLTSIMPETKDSDFSWKDYQARVNGELVNILGNFVHRILSLSHKYYGGLVPVCGELSATETELWENAQSSAQSYADNLDKFRFRDALASAMQIARAGNKYLADTEPWHLIKTDPERVKTVIYTSLQIIRQLSAVIRPFLPNTSAKMDVLLNLSPLTGADFDFSGVPSDNQLNPAEMLFQRVEDAVIQKQLDKLEAIRAERQSPPGPPLSGGETTAPSALTTNVSPLVKGGRGGEIPPQKETIQYEDFEKIDLRVATVLAAEAVPKTDKLLKLTIDTGVDQRTIVSGIAQYYKPEDLVGKQVLVLINLAPRKLRGIESQGMILMAEDAEGRLSLMQPAGAPNAGAIVK